MTRDRVIENTGREKSSGSAAKGESRRTKKSSSRTQRDRETNEETVQEKREEERLHKKRGGKGLKRGVTNGQPGWPARTGHLLTRSKAYSLAEAHHHWVLKKIGWKIEENIGKS
ncbi:hypothetical protein M9H77_07477 [Catharanthus roseus]|uniref:Uncharacterized protein n=1 Tax=Catharanthus roseus TaxID=4058 RepID=A0ACC0BVA2_CATRO|nr:hypothetical protein M9H77_07477 [Catharanthus roseus]